MLNKTKIIVAAASLLITGVGAGTGAYLATRNNDTGASATSEVTSMGSSRAESVDTSPIDSAVSAGIEQIQSAASEAIQQIESKAGQQSKASSEATSSAPKSPLEIPLNVETQRGDGTLTFMKFTIKYNQYNQIVFDYKTSAPGALTPLEEKTTLATKSGKIFKAEGMGGARDEGTIWFTNVTDYPDLSRVTLTYAFVGFDPVTITFDIPLQ